VRCSEAKSRMSAYLDGELHTESSLAMASHIEQCATCREDLAELQSVDALIQGSPKIEVSKDFSRQVLARAKEWDELALGKRPGTSAFASFLQLLEDLLDSLVRDKAPVSDTLDEFGDFPPLSMGCIYFHIMGQSIGGQ
jgi:anti-sigma factor RsiW